MGLLDKVKNMIFEDDEIEETEVVEEVKQEEKKPKLRSFKDRSSKDKSLEDEVVKKIDIEKTVPKKIELPKEEIKEEKPVLPKREHRVTPMIFDEEDFIMEEEPIKPLPPKKEIKKEEPKKPLYAGYRDEKQKEKFKPSPVLSPVYGFVGVSPVLEQPRNDELSSFNEMFAKEKKEVVTLDEVRNKAFGGVAEPKETPETLDDDDLGLLYDMKQDESPAISKITLGDAEEYFDDLGLEYNVDYKDSAKERSVSRSQKSVDLVKENKEPIVDNLEEKILESTAELEITKEQLQPKTAREIKKVTKIKDLEIPEEPDEIEEPDEKNLYDLIDMMYESKE